MVPPHLLQQSLASVFLLERLWLCSCITPFRCGPECLIELLTGRRGTRAARSTGTGNRGPTVPRGAASARAPKESSVAKLAKFFPDVTPVRIPIRLTRLASQGSSFSENTVIEFGTPREVLFASSLPLEFADILRIENSDGSLQAEASVVALQYHGRGTAVAARFTAEVANWIVKS